MVDNLAALAARGVLSRLLGDRSDDFVFTSVPEASERDVFKVEAKNGRVFVQGSSAIALCRGAYEYLKDACHLQVSWSTNLGAIPPKWPDWESTRIVSNHRYRQYFSVCTPGYSSAWWDWARWEKEIDWMAIHGINMPLSLNGQELIWQRVYRQLGVSEEDIQAHFSGPAYLPWHRLGNLNGHLGPLPQSWIDGQAALQEQILNRERELGMSPVVPGFSGFVPVAFQKIRPDVVLRSAEAWAGFPQTTFVDPRHPSYFEIGSLFLKEYEAEFGASHHYLCETFAEQIPQFKVGGELEELCAIGEATWRTLERHDPEAHWVMQGWPFYFARDYWQPEKATALFDAVPKNRLVVLDLATEELEVWREQPTIRAKGWVFNVVHNYGQTTNLQGDLQAFADRAANAVADSRHGNMLGMGIAPEGIDQNPVVYELLTDIMWRQDRVDVSTWLSSYARSRYGAAPDCVQAAWKILLNSVYGPPAAPTLRYSWRYRPGDQPPLPNSYCREPFEAACLMNQASEELAASSAYRRDLVDVTKTWLSGLADRLLDSALSTAEAPQNPQLPPPWGRSVNPEERRRTGKGGESETEEVLTPMGMPHKALFFEVLQDLDRLMATRPEHRLSTWISAARHLGADQEEADPYERNARTLITVWGGPFLFDYATREWAGVIKDFHLRRWQLYFKALETGSPMPDFDKWEANWSQSTDAPTESGPEESIVVVNQLLVKYAGAPIQLNELGSLPVASGDSQSRSLSLPEGEGGVRELLKTPKVRYERSEQPSEAINGLPHNIETLHFGPLPTIDIDHIDSESLDIKTIVIDLEKLLPVVGVMAVPKFGQGFRGTYSIQLSTDGEHWSDVGPTEKRPTARGTRQSCEPTPSRFVRLLIQPDLGDPAQLFQVSLFVATPSAP